MKSEEISLWRAAITARDFYNNIGTVRFEIARRVLPFVPFYGHSIRMECRDTGLTLTIYEDGAMELGTRKLPGLFFLSRKNQYLLPALLDTVPNTIAT